MSHATAGPERTDGLIAPAPRPALLRRMVLLYSLYAVAVCATIAAGRPRWALAVTSIALGGACLSIPGRRRAAIALLIAAPLVILPAVAELARPLVFFPPVALNLGLAAVFARSLKSGREPLISSFARAERGSLEPDLARYTRRLTGVWVAFFIGAAATSAWLAAAASPAVWGAFVAVGNHAAVAALFMGEFAFRRWRFPQYRHVSPLGLAAIVVARWRRPGARP